MYRTCSRRLMALDGGSRGRGPVGPSPLLSRRSLASDKFASLVTYRIYSLQCLTARTSHVITPARRRSLLCDVTSVWCGS